MDDAISNQTHSIPRPHRFVKPRTCCFVLGSSLYANACKLICASNRIQMRIDGASQSLRLVKLYIDRAMIAIGANRTQLKDNSVNTNWPLSVGTHFHSRDIEPLRLRWLNSNVVRCHSIRLGRGRERCGDKTGQIGETR